MRKLLIPLALIGDLLFKLRLLRIFISDATDTWRELVWNRELDSNYCCDGRECCCGGETVRQVFSYQTKRLHSV